MAVIAAVKSGTSKKSTALSFDGYGSEAGSSPRAQYHPCVDHSTHGVVYGNPVCSDHPQSGYDCVMRWGRGSSAATNPLQNAAVGRGSPSPYRSSYAASTGKAENSWNSAPCSTKVLEERCWRSANPCGAGREYRWKCLLHRF